MYTVEQAPDGQYRCYFTCSVGRCEVHDFVYNELTGELVVGGNKYEKEEV